MVVSGEEGILNAALVVHDCAQQSATRQLYVSASL